MEDEKIKMEAEEETKTEAPKETKETKKVLVFGCRRLNIRKAPTSNAPVLGTVAVNEELTLKGALGKEWVCVETEEISKGFVMTEFVQEV